MATRLYDVDPRSLVALFPDVPAPELTELAAASRASVYRAGESIVGNEGSPAPGVVAEGRVRLVVRSADGREASLHSGGAGTLFGIFTIFEDEPASRKVERSLVALERTTVIHLDRTIMRRLVLGHGALCGHLVYSLAASASMVTDSAARYAFMSVRQRLTTHLLASAVQDSSGLTVRATQQQLASAVGSVREVVSRILRDLRSDGLISVGRGRVVILDRNGLAGAGSI